MVTKRIEEEDRSEDGRLVEAARKVEDVGHNIGDRMTAAKEKVKDAVTRTREAAGNVREKSVGEVVDDVRGAVKRNPGKSILISLGAGLLLGRFLSR
jgi:ElaB/YqjD/DUF883 family membrane-anchored ribosome-binding protein